jgi:NAD(P)-dependent dehydrogenase (short-subunit alcohol dehydrogenase family)
VKDILGYGGAKVIVSGGGGAGMGAAAVGHLVDLGAEVHVLDLKEPPVPVAGFHHTDLRRPEQIEAAVRAIGGGVRALFNCAGLPGGRFSDVDTMVVNFVALRHLSDLVAEGMEAGAAIASISSAAGAGWQANREKWMPLISTDGFEAARVWVEEHPEEIASGYAPSKEAIITWTVWRSYELAGRGIRINVTSPGPTDTPMMPDFEAQVGKAFMDKYPIPLGHRASPEEQALPLIFLNSPMAAAVTGENLTTDGGTMAALAAGTMDMSAFAFDQIEIS